MYGSWGVERDRQNFLSVWAILCPFTPLTTQKIKILKKWKKHLKISPFYNCVPQMTMIWCMVPEIWSVTHNFLSFWPFFALYPGDIIILHMFTKKYVHMMYGSWDMVRDRHTDGRKKWHIEVGTPPKKFVLPMRRFFKKNVPIRCVCGREETLWFIFVSFPISKSFIPNFCGTNYDLSSKTT